MDIPNNFYRTSIKALILDEGKKFMLVREDDDRWELPGGGMDFGENYEQTLKREIEEELGLEIKTVAKYPTYFTAFTNPEGTWVTNIIYEVTLTNFEFTSSSECREIGFFDKESAAKIKSFPSVKALIEVFDPKRH